MTIELTPEFGVEIPDDVPYVDLLQRAEAACRSATLLAAHGLDAEPTPADKEAAAALTAAYAQDPIKTSTLISNIRASTMTPASLVAVREYLDEYGRQVVTHAVELRHMVTNRLIEESRNPDPRIRIRALELLGKHSDVGLFTDRTEITHTHQTTDELKQKLRAKLQKLVQLRNPQNETVIEMGGDIIDVDAELGLGEQKPPSDAIQGENNDENRTESAKNPIIFVPDHE